VSPHVWCWRINPDALVPFHMTESYQASAVRVTYAVFADSVCLTTMLRASIVERPGEGTDRSGVGGPHLEEGKPYGKNQPYLLSFVRLLLGYISNGIIQWIRRSIRTADSVTVEVDTATCSSSAIIIVDVNCIFCFAHGDVSIGDPDRTGYAVDRRIGTTDGLGGLFGLLQGMGSPVPSFVTHTTGDLLAPLFRVLGLLPPPGGRPKRTPSRSRNINSPPKNYWLVGIQGSHVTGR